MMFFRHNKDEKPLTNDDIKRNRLIKFFQDTNRDELMNFSDELSTEAKQLFDGSVQSLLGQMPEDMALTNVTLNKSALKQLLFSSMVTGYLTKSLEIKMDLDKYMQDTQSEDIENQFSVDKQLKILGDDDFKGIL